MHAILVHGWEGWPENAWFPWLRRELGSRGWTTEALKMPDPALPKRTVWVDTIRRALGRPETVLIGHSLGCAAILWTLANYEGPPLTRVVLVSGFGRPFSTILKKAGQFHHDWFPHPLDLSAIKPKARSWAVVHAHRDPLVPFEEGEWLAKQLGVKLIVPARSGHLMHVEGALEVPEILEAALGEEHV